jgi:hypothetical protein
VWPFSRKPRDTDAVPARPDREWADLDPLEPTFGPAPLTLPASFNKELAGRRSPEVAAEPLGHRMSLDAPAGLVLNLATPIPSRTDGPAMVPRVQRRPVETPTRAQVNLPEAAEATPIIETPALDLPVLPAPPPTAGHLTTLAPQAQIEPVRSIPLPTEPLLNVGSRAEGSHESEALPFHAPAPRLTLGQTRRLGLGAPLSHVPPVQRASAEPIAQDVDERPPSPTPTAASAPVPVAEAGPPAMGESPASVQRTVPLPAQSEAPAEMPLARRSLPAQEPAAPAAEAHAAPPAVAPGATLAPSPPAVGAAPGSEAAPTLPSGPAEPMAPLAGLAPISTLSGQPQAPADDVGADEPAAEGAGEPSPVEMPLAPSPGGSRPTAESASPATPRPAAAAAAETPEEPEPSAEAGEEPGAQASRAPASRAPITDSVGSMPDDHRTAWDAMAPISGARPLVLPAASVQRAPDVVPAGLQTRLREGFGVDAGEARIHRDGVGGRARRLNARAFTQAGEVFLPSDQGPLESAGTQALLAHELTHVAQQRRFGSALPAESSPSGQRLEAEAQQVERTLQTQASMPLAAPRRPSQGLGADTVGIGASGDQAGTGTMFATTTGPSEGFGSASSTVSASSAQLAAGEQPFAQRAGPAGTPSLHGGATPAPASTEHDLDELARKLYDRIRSRIRNELLVDRERAGVLTDRR